MLTSPRYHDRSLAAEDVLRSAFEFRNDVAPYIIYDANYWLFGELPEQIPRDYCDADPGGMIAYQQEKIERHVREYDNLCLWMYDHPEVVHDLMQQVTDALIEWVRLQKEVAGQAIEDDAYVLGVKIPSGFGGVWISDDDCIVLGPDLYREFVVPYNSQVLTAFGGGSIHFCGKADQHVENYVQTEGLRAIQNLHLDALDSAARLRHALAEKNICYIVADFNVEDAYIEEYYENLFAKLGTKGLIVVPYIAPSITLAGGSYGTGERDPQAVGRAIERAIRKFNR